MTFAYLAAELRGGDDVDARVSARRDEGVPQRPTPAEDVALVERMRAGDGVAFDTFVTTHAPSLIAFGTMLLGVREEAEDVVQDVLLAFWNQRATFTINGPLRTYLLTSVRRRALNVLAHRSVEARHEGEIARQQTAETVGDDMELDDVTLWRMVRALPVRWQEGVTLRYVAGLPYGEVGRVLGISEAAARMLVGRAVEALRAQLAR